MVVELEHDDEGWPPVGAERVWAERVGRHRYRIDTDLADAWGVVALSVAPDADLTGLKDTLDAGTADGSWGYEEGRLSTGWLAATAND